MSDQEGTRTLCSILEDLRKCYATRNFSYYLGLIEEAQYRANRMESSISDAHEQGYSEKARIELKQEIKKLRRERDELEKQIGETEK